MFRRSLPPRIPGRLTSRLLTEGTILAKRAELKTEDGHQRLVRNGHLLESAVMTVCCGPSAMCAQSAGSRGVSKANAARIASRHPRALHAAAAAAHPLPEGHVDGDFSWALRRCSARTCRGVANSNRPPQRMRLDEYANLRRIAGFFGALSFFRGLPSSSKITLRIQCNRFSTLQYHSRPRAACGRRCVRKGDNMLEHRLRRAAIRRSCP